MITDDRLKFARRCPAHSAWQEDVPRFFTPETREQLLERGRIEFGADQPPLARIRTPNARATFLISQLDPEAPHIAFGLADMGRGPEIGEIDLNDLAYALLADGWTVTPDTDYRAPSDRLSDLLLADTPRIAKRPRSQPGRRGAGNR